MARGSSSGLARYWPVLAVVAVIIAAVAFATITRQGDPEAAGGTAASASGDGKPPAWAAQPEADPMAAPDCDKSTGRMMMPTFYAPNCVALWPAGKDNGGVTSPGVTGNEITVAVYIPQQTAQSRALNEEAGSTALTLTEEETDANRAKVVQAYQALSETYGRKVNVVKLPAGGSNSDDATARSDAIKAATEMKAFAVIGGPTGTNAFVEELVARQVLCFCTATQPIENYERWAPYVWPTQMASTQAYMLRAEFIKALANKPAEYAGDALKATPRKFGVVYFDTTDNAYRSGIEYFEQRLSESNIQLAAKIPYVLDLAKAAEDAKSIIAKLKGSGVTSVIVATDAYMPRYLTAEAKAQNYVPEWVIAGSAGTDSATFARLYDQEQWRHAFGMSLTVARTAVDVQNNDGNPVPWYLGEKLTSYPNIFELGRLFTGVTLAGPKLTPENFRDGLFSQKPVQGHLTFTASSYGNHGIWPWTDYPSTDDITLLWWDATATGPNESDKQGTGMYRYPDGGKRYLPGQLPGAAIKMFDPAGTSMIYEQRPPADQVPQYPRRAGRV
jgi:hypothetical protein